jgi:ribonucleoside-diphosphate reductase alpha chain
VAHNGGVVRPRLVRRRDGTLVPFDQSRITAAISRAAREAGEPVPAAEVAARVAATLDGRRAPSVETIQDAVESALMAAGFPATARAYVLYRRQRAELREAKAMLGVRDELKLSLEGVLVVRERCLRKDLRGRPIESTGEMMDRVAHFVARAEDGYRPGTAGQWAERFAAVLRRLEFLPNSPTLMNAGTPVGVLSGCFVLPLDDSLRSIFTTLGHAALLHQAGAGTGYTFSDIRPAGDVVASTGGRASGPVSFLRVFDVAADVVREGGRRRGANMAVLDAGHPDVFDFVRAKLTPGRFENFNFSVGVTDAFMRAVERDGTHRLVNPRTGRTVARVPARELFGAICEAAWASGDPGLLFLDRINRDNPLPGRGRIRATNPCGEVPLLPYESCNLGSVNLARFVRDGRLDWDGLAAVVEVAVRFLDDVIDVSRYPVPELADAARATRKVGLGVMGLAEVLAALGIPYDSPAAVRLGGRLARAVQAAAHAASARLAAERGAFPLFAESTFAARGLPPLRNAQLTAVAPTGTISLIAGTTSGIEPMFAIAYSRRVLGRRLLQVNPLFERIARERGFYSEELIAELARTGSARRHPGLPPDVRRAFVTALEIAPEWHLRMQAAVQRSVDAAASKTVNLPATATVADVRAIYLAAWRARVKGITVYRYGSRPNQVLALAEEGEGARVEVGPTYAGGCAGHACEF